MPWSSLPSSLRPVSRVCTPDAAFTAGGQPQGHREIPSGATGGLVHEGEVSTWESPGGLLQCRMEWEETGQPGERSHLSLPSYLITEL